MSIHRPNGQYVRGTSREVNFFNLGEAGWCASESRVLAPQVSSPVGSAGSYPHKSVFGYLYLGDWNSPALHEAPTPEHQKDGCFLTFSCRSSIWQSRLARLGAGKTAAACLSSMIHILLLYTDSRRSTSVNIIASTRRSVSTLCQFLVRCSSAS